MATHSSILAWRITCTEEPGELESMGHRVGHDWAHRAHTCTHTRTYTCARTHARTHTHTAVHRVALSKELSSPNVSSAKVKKRSSIEMYFILNICLKFPLICFPCVSACKESACNAGDLGLIPGLGRSLGKGISYPLQYSGLENSTWGCKESDMTEQLSFHFTSYV